MLDACLKLEANVGGLWLIGRGKPERKGLGRLPFWAMSHELSHEAPRMQQAGAENWKGFVCCECSVEDFVLSGHGGALFLQWHPGMDVIGS